MFFELETMWDRHLGPTKASHHRVKLFLANWLPIYKASYRAGPKVPIFEKYGTAKMLELDLIEQAQIG